MPKTPFIIYHPWSIKTEDMGQGTKDIRHKDMGLMPGNYGLEAGNCGLKAGKAREYPAPHTHALPMDQGTNGPLVWPQAWDASRGARLNTPLHSPSLLYRILKRLNTPQRSGQGALMCRKSGHHSPHAFGAGVGGRFELIYG